MSATAEVLDIREQRIAEKESLAVAIESAAAGIVVRDAEGAAFAADFDRRAKAAADEIEAARLEITEPLNAVLKIVNGRAKPLLARIDAARKSVKNSIAAWHDAERRRAEEAARIANEKAEAERRRQEALAAENLRKAEEARQAEERARREAEEAKARGDAEAARAAEAEAKRKAADAARQEERAAAQEQKAATVPAYAPVAPTAPAGMSAARPWRATCTDLEALLVAAVTHQDAAVRAIARGMLKVEFSQQAGNRQAQATKNLVAVPGVVFGQETSVRQSGR